MAEYRLTFASSVRKDFRMLDVSQRNRVMDAIRSLAREPRPHGCRKLRNSENSWRIRVGEYRVVYTIDDTKGVVDIGRVRHRREAY